VSLQNLGELMTSSIICLTAHANKFTFPHYCITASLKYVHGSCLDLTIFSMNLNLASLVFSTMVIKMHKDDNGREQ
jgi:hypothetical protein